MDEQITEPTAIFQKHEMVVDGKTVTQVLIHQRGHTQDEATQVNHSDFLLQFPDHNLEDKVAVTLGGSDTSMASQMGQGLSGPKKLKSILKQENWMLSLVVLQ